MVQTLTQIGLKNNTDKAYFHKYTDLYDKHLTHLRNENINLLEIGIDRAASLNMWAEYFKNGNIYGVDINNKTEYVTNRIYTCIGDQDNYDSIKSVYPTVIFDIIIDDGGHTVKQQLITLIALFERLKPGGIYILEDLHTSLTAYSSTEPTTLKLLTLMQNKKEITDDFCIHGITKEQLQNVYDNISTLTVEYLKPGEPESITSIFYKKL